jgi:hypothetical protein
LKRPLKFVLQLVRKGTWHSEQRRPSIDYTAALAVVTEIKLLTPDADRKDANLPMTKVWHGHWRPSKLRLDPFWVVAAEGDFTEVIITVSKKDPKAGVPEATAICHHVEEAELWSKGKRIQAKAEHAIKRKRCEWFFGHRCCPDDTHVNAARRRDGGLCVISFHVGQSLRWNV